MAQAFVAPHAKPLPRGGVVVRAAAVLVDYIIVALGLMAFMFFLALTAFFAFAFVNLRWSPSFWDHDSFPGMLHGPEVMFPTMWMLALAYFAYFEGRDGRTFGKRVFNLRVLRSNGAPVTYREAIVRNLVKVFPPLLLLDTVFLVVFFYEAKQRVSDRLADTIVVEGAP